MGLETGGVGFGSSQNDFVARAMETTKQNNLNIKGNSLKKALALRTCEIQRNGKCFYELITLQRVYLVVNML